MAKRMGGFAVPAILIVTAAVLFILCIGLCGLGMTNQNNGAANLVGVGLVSLGLSIVTFGVGVVWLIVAAIANRRR
jgi:DNA-binding transcriptional regulator of glucitol operon